MSAINFSGLATGLDTNAIISQLMQIERIPVRRLEDRKKSFEAEANKLRSFRTRLTGFGDATAKLTRRRDVLTTATSSSDERVFTASAIGLAAPGPTSIHVTSLAQAHKTYSDAFSSATEAGAFDEGSITIQVGDDDPVTIAVAAEDSLETIVGKLNGASADLTAGLIFDGSAYRLRVTGNETGASRAIQLTETGVTLGLADPSNVVQAAADAAFTVDGIPMNRAANSFADAVPGVRITLTGLSAGDAAATLEVQRDPTSVVSDLEKVIDGYNDVMRSINAEFTNAAGALKPPGSLSGDSTLRGLQSRLRATVGSTVEGATPPYRTLSSIGLSTSRDGMLSLDRSKLDEALASDPEAVVRLLAGDDVQGGAMRALGAVAQEYARPREGLLSQRIDALGGRSRGIDSQIDRFELRLERTENRLRAQYAALEQLVSGLQTQGNQILAVLDGLRSR